jgi:hypothetical protein
LEIRKVRYLQRFWKQLCADDSAMGLGGSIAPSSAAAARTDAKEMRLRRLNLNIQVRAELARLLDPT